MVLDNDTNLTPDDDVDRAASWEISDLTMEDVCRSRASVVEWKSNFHWHRRWHQIMLSCLILEPLLKD